MNFIFDRRPGQFARGVAYALVSALAFGVGAGDKVLGDEPSFLRDIAPILLRRCAGCHGPNKSEGDYRLHTWESLTRAGASDAAPLTAGRPDDSELYRRLIETDPATRMPQLDDPLAATELAVIRAWIAAGGRFDGADPRRSIKSQLPPRTHRAPPEAYRLPVPIYSLAFTPSGEQLIVAGRNEVTVWNARSGQLERRVAGLPPRVQSLALAADGTRLYVGGGSPGEFGELSIVDLRSGERPRVLDTFDDLVLSVAADRQGLRVYAASADRSVRGYAAATGESLWQSRLHSNFVTSLAVTHDNRFVVTGSKDFTAKVLEADSGKLFTTYNGHQRQYGEEKGRFEIWAAAASDTRPLVFTAGEGRSVRVWVPEQAQAENGSAADMEERFSKAGHTKYLYHDATRGAPRLVTRGDLLVVGTMEGPVRLFDMATLKPLRVLEGHRQSVFAVDCHEGTRRVASGSYDGEVRVWNSETGELVVSFRAAPGFVQ